MPLRRGRQRSHDDQPQRGRSKTRPCSTRGVWQKTGIVVLEPSTTRREHDGREKTDMFAITLQSSSYRCYALCMVFIAAWYPLRGIWRRWSHRAVSGDRRCPGDVIGEAP